MWPRFWRLHELPWPYDRWGMRTLRRRIHWWCHIGYFQRLPTWWWSPTNLFLRSSWISPSRLPRRTFLFLQGIPETIKTCEFLCFLIKISEWIGQLSRRSLWPVPWRTFWSDRAESTRLFKLLLLRSGPKLQFRQALALSNYPASDWHPTRFHVEREEWCFSAQLENQHRPKRNQLHILLDTC
jgi:hypothetical protein